MKKEEGKGKREKGKSGVVIREKAMKLFTTNHLLAALGVLAGFILLAAADIGRKDPVTKVPAPSAPRSVAPTTVADWILKGETDYRIIDLRAPEAFAKQSIPTSENMTPEDFRKAEFDRMQCIIVVDSSDEQSHADAALLLSRNIPGARALKGGIDGWIESVLHPPLPGNATAEDVALYNRRLAAAKYFKGETDLGSSPAASPKITAAPLPALGGKKKKEGC